MKKITFFALLVLSTTLAFSQIKVPTVRNLFESRSVGVSSGDYLCGTVKSISYSDPNVLTGKRKLSSIIIGDINYKIDIAIYNEDYIGINIGELVFIKVLYGISLNQTTKRGFGSGEIVKGDFLPDDDVDKRNIIEYKKELTVDQYFEEDIGYGSREIILSGKISELLTPYGELRIILSANDGQEVICSFDEWRWKGDSRIINKIQSLKVNTICYVRGHFIQEMPFKIFDILEIK